MLWNGSLADTMQCASTRPQALSYDTAMTKTEAIQLLGGNATTAARAIGCSPQAVRQWPAILPPRIRDRVQAARWRLDVTLQQAKTIEGKRAWARAQEVGKT